MPALNISKSITIDKSLSEVYQELNTFHHWRIWSPWLIQEPEAESKVSDDGKFQSWEGARVGSGNMTITDEKENEYVAYDLNFLKPWKSKAKVRFELDQVGDLTEVTWTMNGSIPFFMFWMKGMMEALVGMDYERGLMMLKDYLEEGEVQSKIKFQGTGDFSGFKYIALDAKTTRENIAASMEEVFGKLTQYAADSDKVSGSPFTIYRKWEIAKGKVEYTAGFPVNEIPSNLPNEFVTGEISQTSVYSIKHTGPYEQLGNAWSTLYNLKQNKAFKANSKIHPFEVYVNDPREVSSKDLETIVYFPVK